MKKKIIKTIIIMSMLAGIGIFGNWLYAQENIGEERFDWNLWLQSSASLRYLYPQGGELSYYFFVNNAYMSTAKALHNEGGNIGGRVGYREVGLSIGYGWLERLMGAFLSTGWNVSLTYDYIFHGTHDLRDNNHYVGIELEGSFFHINPSIGVKTSLSQNDEYLFFVGCGLRW